MPTPLTAAQIVEILDAKFPGKIKDKKLEAIDPFVVLDPADLVRAVEQRADVVAVVQAAGYRYVTLDLEGFRSGNLSR